MKIIALLLFAAMLLSIWLLPSLTPALGVLFLFFSLAMGIVFIFKKHKQSENPQLKIVKEILVLIIGLLLVILFGGVAGAYAHQYVALRFGIIAGILSALAASFAAGYLVKWGMMQVVK